MPYNDQNPLPGGITWGDILPPDSPPSPAPPQKRPRRGGIGWGEILGILGSIAESAGDLFGSKASPRAPKNVRIERYQPTMVNIPEVPIRPVQWELPLNNRNQAKKNIGQKALQQLNSHDEKKELLHRITQSTRAKNYLQALNNGQGPLYEAMYGKPDMSALEINTPAPSIEAIVNSKSASPSWVPDERFESPKRIAREPIQGRVQQTATSPQELFPPSNTGTRPYNESGALYQYEEHIRPATYSPTPLSQAEMNDRQKVLNQLFGGTIFDRNNMAYPYELDKGQVVPQKNIAQMIGVANWILSSQVKTTWTNAELIKIKQRIQKQDFTDEQRRKLEIAYTLNHILRENESLESHRDDALAFAKGLKVLIGNNTDRRGRVNEARLMEDLKFFMIDQRYDFFGFFAKHLHSIGESNAAYNLFAGRRIGTIGWSEKYWDKGVQYDENGAPINQVHHFVGFLIIALQVPEEIKSFSVFEATVLDGLPNSINQQDIDLAILAIWIAWHIRNGVITWKDLPEWVYDGIKS